VIRRAMERRRLCRNLGGAKYAGLVAEDPHPEPTGLDRIGGTYPTRATVHATLGDALRSGETVLLLPHMLDLATDALMDLMPAGEHGHIGELRRGVNR
jgi:hypothetical protein